jgi:hypothetical protein
MSPLNDYIIRLILIGLLIIAFIRWLMVSKHFSNGYVTCHDHGRRGITKTYNETKVTFFSWGSSDISADGNDPYLGIYCIINSNKDLDIELRQYFDEVDKDFHQDRFIFTLKKTGLYLGSSEMKNFIQKIDPILSYLATTD